MYLYKPAGERDPSSWDWADSACGASVVSKPESQGWTLPIFGTILQTYTGCIMQVFVCHRWRKLLADSSNSSSSNRNRSSWEGAEEGRAEGGVRATTTVRVRIPHFKARLKNILVLTLTQVAVSTQMAPVPMVWRGCWAIPLCHVSSYLLWTSTAESHFDMALHHLSWAVSNSILMVWMNNCPLQNDFLISCFNVLWLFNQ